MVGISRQNGGKTAYPFPFLFLPIFVISNERVSVFRLNKFFFIELVNNNTYNSLSTDISRPNDSKTAG